MLISKSKIAKHANSLFDEIVKIRRDLHRHPELSGLEYRTAEIVTTQLKSSGLNVRSGIGGNGVLGILHGSMKGPIVAYRADMDAIPQEIREKVAFQSVTPGISHACGHDVHTTIGLGIAKVLSSLKDELPGTVAFIFQPAEENAEGAKQMIAEGILEHTKPEAIFAIHIAPFECGSIVTNPGVGLPGIDEFTIKLRGSKNLETATLALVETIRAIGTVQRPDKVTEWERYSKGLLIKNSFFSCFVFVIANIEESFLQDERVIRGFFKASSKIEYNQARLLIQRALSNLEKQGVYCEMDYKNCLPEMCCNKELAEWAIDPLTAMLGEQSVLYAHNNFPFFGEDFAYFLERIPGVMFFLGGSKAQKSIQAIPHSPNFEIDEEAILVGVKGMSNVLTQYLLESKRRQVVNRKRHNS